MRVCRLMIAEEGWEAKKTADGHGILLRPPKGWQPGKRRDFCDDILAALLRRKHILRGDEKLAKSSPDGRTPLTRSDRKKLRIPPPLLRKVGLCSTMSLGNHQNSPTYMLLRIQLLSAFKLKGDKMPDWLWEKATQKVRDRHTKMCKLYGANRN